MSDLGGAGLPGGGDGSGGLQERPPQTGRSRRKVAGPLIALLAVGLCAWLAVSGLVLFQAARAAQEGLDEMKDLQSVATGNIGTFVDSVGGGTDDIDEEGASDQLANAAQSFARAHDLASSPLVRPLYLLPFLGRQLRSVEAMSDAAETTASASSEAFDELEDVLSGASETAESRVLAAERTQRVLNDLQDDIDDLDLGPSENLVGRLASARSRFADEYGQVTETLQTATTAVDGVTDLLKGPSRYLVLAANNSEMRAGSGMYLQIGVMEVADGEFEVGDFVPARELLLDSPGTVLDSDVERNWGSVSPDLEWRNLNLTPRFDESARMAAEMWAASGRGDVDGVIAVDVIGLQNLLELTGPVDVGTPGAPDVVSADTVVQDLLLDQYLDFVDDRDARRDRLGRVVGGVLESFNSRPVSAGGLLKVLQRDGEARHVLLWSSDPVQQDAWDALEASGRLPENSLMLSVLNRGGNKLDQFLPTWAEISAEPNGEYQRVSVDIELKNTAPMNLPQYVAGPYPRSGLAAGEYLGIASLTVPKGAGNFSVDGAPAGFIAEDGPTRVATVPVRIGPGGSAEFTVSFDLSDTWSSIVVQPSARVPPTSWTAGELEWKDTSPQRVDLEGLEG